MLDDILQSYNEKLDSLDKRYQDEVEQLADAMRSEMSDAGVDNVEEQFQLFWFRRSVSAISEISELTNNQE